MRVWTVFHIDDFVPFEAPGLDARTEPQRKVYSCCVRPRWICARIGADPGVNLILSPGIEPDPDFPGQANCKNFNP